MVQQIIYSQRRCLKLFNLRPPNCRKDTNSLAARVLAALRILHWDGKESLNTKFNRTPMLGFGKWQSWPFGESEISFLYTTWNWVYLAINTSIAQISFPNSKDGGRAPMERLVLPYRYKLFGIGQLIFLVHTNDVYHKLKDRLVRK